jgi:dephospho-CoA kinase
MIRVGITGGIGSGKSLVCQVFSRLGIPVYYADTAAKTLMEHDASIRNELISLLGEDIYYGDSLNRIKLSALIFHNEELLTKVNRIVHPRVAADFLKWCACFSVNHYIIQESAILFESEAYRLFDYIVLVTAPEEVRFRRVITREGMTAEKIQSIMKNQMQEEELRSRSQSILENDEKSLLLPQILKLHSELMQIR